MRYILSIVIIVLFAWACEKQVSYYLKEEDIFRFETGDTIFYKSGTLIDTFTVYVNRTIMTSDKRLTVESLMAHLTELSSNCQGYYCDIYAEQRGNSSPSVSFRNLSVGEVNTPTQLYTLSNGTSIKVNQLNSNSCSDTIPKSVKTVYYSQKYGIVAYELCSGAVFEIQNKLSK